MPSWNEENVLRRRQKILEGRNLLYTISDPGSGGTITPSSTHLINICDMTSAGVSETRTLDDPAFLGQEIILLHGTDGGEVTITSTDTFDGTNDIALFADANDCMIVKAGSTAEAGWKVTVNSGTALSASG